jgi:ABC-2 type transport system ATP-binding protein
MIELNNITKTYGKTIIIENLSFSIEAGQVYGLLGKNGVGKSTLINMIIDLVKIDEGVITILNEDSVDLDKNFKSRIGVLSEDIGLIEELNAYEYLNFIGKIYKIPKDILTKRINDLFAFFFENETELRKSIKGYSTGMKKKLAFCAAIIHTPEILILDEPFSGLDPFVANQMIQFLQKYQRADRAILISSHDLNYVEKIATHIGVLDNKTLQFNASVQEFTENGVNHLDAALLKVIQPNTADLENIDWI